MPARRISAELLSPTERVLFSDLLADVAALRAAVVAFEAAVTTNKAAMGSYSTPAAVSTGIAAAAVKVVA